jgi:plasmid maintenance system antidote protein VapI
VAILNINKKSIEQLIKEKFEGNYSNFAKTLNMDEATVTNIINNQQGIGGEMLSRLMIYCNANKLDVREFIILDK